MADKSGKTIDPFDVEALEKSLNDSATRVSTIWVSFLIFSLYLLIAAATITHRQLFLAEPIKLPVLNIDLPLWGFFFLAPILFVTLHLYVLIQVLLLARTSAAYNEAVKNVAERQDLTPVETASLRQRLANTLFAQMFAGSPREREGTFGWLLNAMAWLTLAISPILILLTFQFTFLPYHSHLATWTHRLLVALEFTLAFQLWPLVLDPQRDFQWPKIRGRLSDATVRFCGQLRSSSNWRFTLRDFLPQPIPFLGTVAFILLSISLASFPGEPHVNLVSGNSWSSTSCKRWLTEKFDRLHLARITVVDEEKLAKIVKVTSERALEPYQGERTRSFRGRQFGCADLSNADLRRVDLTGATMAGAILHNADLEGALLQDAQLEGMHFGFATLTTASLEDANLENADGTNANFEGAFLFRARFRKAILGGAKFGRAYFQAATFEGANLDGADLRGVAFSDSLLQGASLENAGLQGASLGYSSFVGASFNNARLQGANLSVGDFRGASFFAASLHGANISNAKLEGAFLTDARLQGVILENTSLLHAWLENAQVRRASAFDCKGAYVRGVNLTAIVGNDRRPPIPLPNSTPGVSLDIVERFIEAATAGIRDAEHRGDLQNNLRKRLKSDLLDETELAKAWNDCELAMSNNLRIEFEKDRAIFLVDLACGDEEGSAIIERIVASSVKVAESGSSPMFLTQLADALDRRICNRVDTIGNATRRKVRGIVKSFGDMPHNSAP